MKKSTPLDVAYADHGRRWQDLIYCYPVISRRSGGLSVGINLNPDKACNFDCVYCQVDRTTPPTTRRVDLELVRKELHALLTAALDGSLWRAPPFDAVPPDRRRVCDIAFSGDGEPTTYPRFAEAVEVAVVARRVFGLRETKIVLITDACYLSRPEVAAGLRLMDASNGEIWAKLDAGTDAYFKEVDRPNFSLRHVLDNIVTAARERPVVIQSLWMRLHGAPPPAEEVLAFCDRLNEILGAGGRLKLIQIYTIARKTAEPYAQMLADDELSALADVVRARVSVRVAVYFGVGPASDK